MNLVKATRRKPTEATPARRLANRDLAPDRIAAILKALDEAYSNAECALAHRSPWELLVATILSAQCTDVRVNMVTPELFKRFPTPDAMAKATLPRARSPHPDHRFFPQQGQIHSGRGPQDRRRIRWPNPANSRRADHHSRRRPQNRQRRSRCELRQGRRSSGRYPRLPHRAAASALPKATRRKRSSRNS